MKHGRTDANQAALVSHIRRIPGALVIDLSGVGKGCPDILVGWRGNNILIEIKDGDKPPSKRKLTKQQEYLHANWTGQIAVVSTLDELWEVMGL